MEAYHCLLPKNGWFQFSQRSGAKICVKHQMSFLSVLEGWAKSDSWVILKKSHKIALDELKQSESPMSERRSLLYNSALVDAIGRTGAEVRVK